MVLKNKLEYACLLGGGAIRGFAHIGAIKAMSELGIKIGTVAGSSVGAIVASALAVGYSYEEIEDIFLNINFELFKDIDFSKVVAISKGNLFLERMREIIETKFYGEKYVKGKNPPVKFKDLDKNLVIITTDLKNFSCKEFSKKSTPDFEVAHAVRISACMPGLMKPVKLDEQLLVDGDLQKSRPMWELCSELNNLKENILEVRLEGSASTNLKNPLSFVNTVYSCITAMASNYVSKCHEFDEKHDCLVIDTGDVLILDLQIKKEARKNLVNMGYEQALKYFKEILPVKKRKALDNYVKLKNKILELKENVRNDHTEDAQIVYAKILEQFLENEGFIDSNIKAKIFSLSDDILNNTTKTLIFKRKFFKNYKLIDKVLNETEKILEDKISEVSNYPWLDSAD